MVASRRAVLATAALTPPSTKSPREGVDFLPLTVDYQEKTYAAGRIPGGYFKREGRPTEKETLVSRLIDRPIRPLFVDGWRNETQVIVTTLSHDMENDPDILALVASSASVASTPSSAPVSPAMARRMRRPATTVGSNASDAMTMPPMRCRWKTCVCCTRPGM